MTFLEKILSEVDNDQTGAYFKNQAEVNNLVNKGSRLLKEHYQYNY